MKNRIFNICNILFLLYLMNVSIGNAQESYDSLKVVTIESKDSSNSLVNVAFGEISESDLIGAISTVNFKELYKKSYSSGGAQDIFGVVAGYNGSIWGQSPLVLVDGVPRTITTIQASEIESVTVLKGASAVVLYGSRATKGVVLITTKRGEVSPLKIDIAVNSGIHVPKAYPNYLDAASYMTLYNEASRNDGKAEKYTDEDIYNTYSGSNPYKYPDNDFYSSEYLKKVYNQTDIVAEIYGGTEKTKYYTNFGMNYNNDLVKYGEYKNNNNKYYHLRSNVDMQLKNWLSASTDLAVVFNTRYTGRGNFYEQASSLRPNKLSPLIPTSMIDPNNESLQALVDNSNHVVDGKYLLGGNTTDQTNVFADMLESGHVNYKHRLFQFKQSVNADLGSLINGLSFKTVFGIDYVNYYAEESKFDYAVYEPTWTTMNGKDMVIDLKKINEDKNDGKERIIQTTYDQTMTFSSQFDYVKSFADHHVNAKLLGWGYQTQESADEFHDNSLYHRISNLNLGLQVSYNFRHKYYLDLAGAMVHSAKLPEGNRRAISPAITAGWRLSEESFLKNNISFIDDLKLYASYAVLNQDQDIKDYYMYKGYYDNKGGWYTWRDGAGGGSTTTSERGDNRNLTFVQREEITAGLTASLFENLITLNANYFLQYTDGLLTQGKSTIYPSYFSTDNESFLPWVNYNKDKRTGVDFDLSLNKNIGELKYSLGLNGMFYATEAVIRDEVYENPEQYRAGKPIDAAWGYICEGFFTDQTDIDNHATQTFGEVRPGDLKYKDVYKDGVIDSKDQVDLGKFGYDATPFSYGVHLTLQWKNLTLFALGTGFNGAIRFKDDENNAYYNRNGNYYNKDTYYYHVYGDRKYSEEVLGRWTEETKNSATYPRLSTTENKNNFKNSTFWMYKYNRFDLTKVQVTYNISKYLSKITLIKAMNVYISGENLLTISKERKLLETNVGKDPQTRFYNIGLKASF